MNDDVAIRVQNVSKSFKLPHERQGSIKNAFINVFRGRTTYEKQQVLKDISFEIKKGEFFGIVGRNGSGKSTLLKLLAGIYAPDKGAIQIIGKLTPFIELGVGFSPELTGRENVFLNGALLGFSRQEMETMYDEIVEFAELEKFMDQKLKNYSSGMQVRLAFAIAIQAKSEILVLDEVLAVGDEAFQRKCLNVFDRYKAKRQTVILVTHDMSNVKDYCTKAILLDEGKIIKIGKPKLIADQYSMLNQEIVDKDNKLQNKNLQRGKFMSIKLIDEAGNEKKIYNSEDKLIISLKWPLDKKVQNIGIAILKQSGETIFGTNTMQEKITFSEGRAIFTVDLKLLAGNYFISAGIFGETRREIIDFIAEGPIFSIRKRTGKEWEGTALLNHEWAN